jgi:[DsrC]-trisulfide reductase subunit J
MKDKGLIVTGLVVFFLLATFPFWYTNLLVCETTAAPEPKLSDRAKAAKKCVVPKEQMKLEHMQILDHWRNTVVRDGQRLYKNNNGTFNMSLSSGNNSCLGCHESKAEFCDACHDYASVEPYCWDCHIDPKEMK